MTMYLIAAALITLGLLLMYLGRGKGSRTSKVQQSHSVSVGGNNSGVIMNTNVGNEPAEEGGEKGLLITGIVVHLAGIAFAVWEIYEKHFAGK